MIKYGILTVSDRCYKKETVDNSGPNLKRKLVGVVVKEMCVPDSIDMIEEVLKNWSKPDSDVDIILTVGGTGFGVRDVTPEATRRVITKETPALSTAITVASLEITPMAMLSRGISGIRYNTLIINLPGSVKGSEECLGVVEPCFKHAIELLRNNTKSIEGTHKIVQDCGDKSEVVTHNLAGRLRTSPWPMLSVKDSIDMVMNNLPLCQVEVVPLRKCLGRIIAEAILANDPLPPFRASIKDGYAVRAVDGLGVYKVVAGYSAGVDDGNIELKPFECVRVNTGSVVPSSADAVVQVEDTELDASDEEGNELRIKVLEKSVPGQDIRDVGSDIPKGETVLHKGDLITGIETGLLATVGVTQVPVFRLPTVSVLSTGNELLEPNQRLSGGMIRDSNKSTLIALLEENAFNGHDMGIAKDEPTELMRSLKKCMAVSDVIITTGSVSMGDKDYLKSVLIKDFSANIHFGRVNMKPGKPTTFATTTFQDKKKLLFCLPGNPVSASVTFYLYVLPALKFMAGFQQPFPTEIVAKTESAIKLDIRPEYKRGTIVWDKLHGELPLVRTTGNQISSRLLSWRYANCLLKLPSSDDAGSSLPANSKVTVLIVGKV